MVLDHFPNQTSFFLQLFKLIIIKTTHKQTLPTLITSHRLGKRRWRCVSLLSVMKTRLSVTILWVLLHLLLCLFVLFLLYSPRLLKVVNWFPILIWKTRAAFSTRPLLRAVNCAYGQHESCFWCRRAASVHSTPFLLDLLKTAPQGGSEGTTACITRPLSHGGAHRGIVWNWAQRGQQLID